MDRWPAHEIRRGLANQVSTPSSLKPLTLADGSSAQRDIIADLQRQQKDIEQSLVAARSRVEACKQASAQHVRTEKDLQIQMQRMEDHAEGLRDALDKENAEDGRIDALLAALKEAEVEKQLNEGSYKDSEAAMKATLQTLKEIRRELSAKNSELGTLQERLQVAESEQNLVKTKQVKILDEKNEAVRLIDQDKQTKAAIEARKEVVKARVIEYNEKANLVSSRVPVDEGETPGSLDKKLDKLSRDLDRYNLEYVSYSLPFATKTDSQQVGKFSRGNCCRGNKDCSNL